VTRPRQRHAEILRLVRRISTALSVVAIVFAADHIGVTLVARMRPELAWALEIADPATGVTRRLALVEAMHALRIPALSVAVIDRDRLAWARAWGAASPTTLFQAASLSKLATAVAALRLVQEHRLSLDADVNRMLASWHIPSNPLDAAEPVTLRGLLSMTGGIGVPGYLGYAPGALLPSLIEILDGVPPATSPPVRVQYQPGHGYAYSGGGYEIVEALIEDATHKPFADAMQELVLKPAGMSNSFFLQPLPPRLAARAATGHRSDGSELPGGWRIVPERAAGGLWSTPADLAKLLIGIGRAYHGETGQLLAPAMAQEMVTRQNGGPYGLGGAVVGSGRTLALMKRGQNIGYQGYLLLFPATGQGLVAMTGSDNGTTLIAALIRRAVVVLRWPPPGRLAE
jgi:CubicO group peptidase (beta-lactamase class C family)